MDLKAMIASSGYAYMHTLYAQEKSNVQPLRWNTYKALFQSLEEY